MKESDFPFYMGYKNKEHEKKSKEIQDIGLDERQLKKLERLFNVKFTCKHDLIDFLRGKYIEDFTNVKGYNTGALRRIYYWLEREFEKQKIAEFKNH